MWTLWCFQKFENTNKMPSKVPHNRPPTFFFSTGLAAQTARKQKSCMYHQNPLVQCKTGYLKWGMEPICKPLEESKTPYNSIPEEFLLGLFDVFSEFSDSCFMLFPSKKGFMTKRNQNKGFSLWLLSLYLLTTE